MHLKISSVTWWPFSPGGDELINVDKMGPWCWGLKRSQRTKFMGQHGAHLGPVGPRWAPCWPHEPCYQGSMPLLLMSWLLVSTSHQQPWYYMCRIHRSLPCLRKDFNHLCHLNVEMTEQINKFHVIFKKNSKQRVKMEMAELHRNCVMKLICLIKSFLSCIIHTWILWIAAILSVFVSRLRSMSPWWGLMIWRGGHHTPIKVSGMGNTEIQLENM